MNPKNQIQQQKQQQQQQQQQQQNNDAIRGDILQPHKY